MASSLLSLRSSFLSSRTFTSRKHGTRKEFVAFSSTSSSEREKDDDKPGFNPFGFVTDNPSSKSAIQLPESPAEDGNVGQMLYRIENKGREYGSYVKSGKLRWFVRETGILTNLPFLGKSETMVLCIAWMSLYYGFYVIYIWKFTWTKFYTL